MPDGVLSESCIFSWKTPSTNVGAVPSKATVAGTPPTVTVAPCASHLRTDVPVIEPVTPGGFVCPPPVEYIVTYEPFAAGDDGPLNVPFWFAAAAGPLPLPLNVNSPGAAIAQGSAVPIERMPCDTTCIMVWVQPATS